MSRKSRNTGDPSRGSPSPAWLTAGRLGFLQALAGGLLWWAAGPTLGWFPLGFLAPLPWLLLARRDVLPGRRPYLQLWLAGCGYWLLTVHWLRYPHPATSLGWLALAAYLGAYLPVFVATMRALRNGLRVPFVASAPVVWTALELAQSHLLTGFNMASLGQTQVRWNQVIQIADLCGAYLVTFVVLLVAACLSECCTAPTRRSRGAWLLAAALPLCAALAYGHWRAMPSGEPLLRVLLVQGSIDCEVKHDPSQRERVQASYLALTDAAVGQTLGVDLIVWPETMYRYPLVVVGQNAQSPPPGVADLDALRELAAQQRQALEDLAIRWSRLDPQTQRLQLPDLLIGVDALEFTEGPHPLRYNSAAFVRAADGQPRLVGRYDKTHPVLFGEYVPLGGQFPWLYRLTPLGSGLETGAGPQALDCRGVRLSPSICYETVVPQVMRGHYAALAAEGGPPDVLVNLTNDGWFRGSVELDQHLICGVFRAVELRRPLLIAANTGFSAWIDGQGRIRERGPRRAEDVLLVDVERDGRDSLYAQTGDVFSGTCLGLTLLGVLAALLVHLRGRRSPPEGSPVAGRGSADAAPTDSGGMKSR